MRFFGAMFFRAEGKVYQGASAVEIVRELEHETTSYTNKGGTVYQFLVWSLDELSDQVPLRELELSRAVSEETLALSYLCLREQYGIGEFLDLRRKE